MAAATAGDLYYTSKKAGHQQNAYTLFTGGSHDNNTLRFDVVANYDRAVLKFFPAAHGNDDSNGVIELNANGRVQQIGSWRKGQYPAVSGSSPKRTTTVPSNVRPVTIALPAFSSLFPNYAGGPTAPVDITFRYTGGSSGMVVYDAVIEPSKRHNPFDYCGFTGGSSQNNVHHFALKLPYDNATLKYTGLPHGSADSQGDIELILPSGQATRIGGWQRGDFSTHAPSNSPVRTNIVPRGAQELHVALPPMSQVAPFGVTSGAIPIAIAFRYRGGAAGFSIYKSSVCTSSNQFSGFTGASSENNSMTLDIKVPYSRAHLMYSAAAHGGTDSRGTITISVNGQNHVIGGWNNDLPSVSASHPRRSSQPQPGVHVPERRAELPPYYVLFPQGHGSATSINTTVTFQYTGGNCGVCIFHADIIEELAPARTDSLDFSLFTGGSSQNNALKMDIKVPYSRAFLKYFGAGHGGVDSEGTITLNVNGQTHHIGEWKRNEIGSVPASHPLRSSQVPQGIQERSIQLPCYNALFPNGHGQTSSVPCTVTFQYKGGNHGLVVFTADIIEELGMRDDTQFSCFTGAKSDNNRMALDIKVPYSAAFLKYTAAGHGGKDSQGTITLNVNGKDFPLGGWNRDVAAIPESHPSRTSFPPQGTYIAEKTIPLPPYHELFPQPHPYPMSVPVTVTFQYQSGSHGLSVFNADTIEFPVAFPSAAGGFPGQQQPAAYPAPGYPPAGAFPGQYPPTGASFGQYPPSYPPTYPPSYPPTYPPSYPPSYPPQ